MAMLPLATVNFQTLGILTLHGSLGERNVEDLRSRLISGLDCVDRLIVSCDQVTAVDMNCLQLLCTAYRVSQTMNKDFIIAGDRRSLFRKAVATTGYANCIGADPACFQDCLWLTR
jgi:anti-anti-sigma regulatory factor